MEIYHCRVPECNIILTYKNCNLDYAIKNHWYICNDCRKKYRNNLRKKNLETHRQRDRDKRSKLKTEQPEKYLAIRKKENEGRRGTRTEYNRSEHSKGLRKKQRLRLKIEVMGYYCTGGIRCKCGYKDIRALSIDHIDGGGNRHRKELKEVHGSTKMYQWLKNNGYPPGFQVLCMNCQFIKRIENDEFHHPSTTIQTSDLSRMVVIPDI